MSETSKSETWVVDVLQYGALTGDEILVVANRAREAHRLAEPVFVARGYARSDGYHMRVRSSRVLPPEDQEPAR